MWDDIEKRGKRYHELRALIESPDGPANPNYSNWLREHGRMGKFGAIWDDFFFSKKTANEAAEMLKDPAADAEFKALAQEELTAAQEKQEAARLKLVDMALNEDDDSARNVILELHKGTGGDEAALFVGDLYPSRIYKVSLEGKVLGVYGGPGRNLGEFGWIHAIACPSENEVWVGELINWRVQKLVTKGARTR